MKYRIVKTHRYQNVMFLVQRLDEDGRWNLIDDGAFTKQDRAEARLTAVLASRDQEDEVIKEVEA